MNQSQKSRSRLLPQPPPLRPKQLRHQSSLNANRRQPPKRAKKAARKLPKKLTRWQSIANRSSQNLKLAATNPPPRPSKPSRAPRQPLLAPECKPCVVKSRDGTFDGEVHGNIPAGSKWARLQIGMHQSEVERILGITSNIRAYVTGKAFIPFYFGSDSHRYEAVYAGQGSVAYTGGGIGGGQGVLMMINFDPKIE